MATKVGSVVLATDQGLGYLAKDFFDHGLIHKILIREHGSRANHRNWYPREAVVSTIEELLECDTLLFFETPFFDEIITRAREKKIKTVIIPMYECSRPATVNACDVVLAPSLLEKHYYPHAEFIPIPVEVAWKERKRACRFVHNGGNGGLGGRNGTKELIESMQYVRSPLQLTIRSQIPLSVPHDPRIRLRIGQFPKEELWNDGDVFIFPEKFNGLSLPLQEAFASGMLVMAGDRFPINMWLPSEPLIPVSSYTRENYMVSFMSANYDPKEIAKTIDRWYDTEICTWSHLGLTWSRENSWAVLKERYETHLSR